jgi:hypothetical protein
MPRVIPMRSWDSRRHGRTDTSTGASEHVRRLLKMGKLSRRDKDWILSPEAAETLRVLVSSALYQIYALTAALIALRRQTSHDIPTPSAWCFERKA